MAKKEEKMRFEKFTIKSREALADAQEKAEESTPADESDILKKLLERRKRELGT